MAQAPPKPPPRFRSPTPTPYPAASSEETTNRPPVEDPIGPADEEEEIVTETDPTNAPEPDGEPVEEGDVRRRPLVPDAEPAGPEDTPPEE